MIRKRKQDLTPQAMRLECAAAVDLTAAEGEGAKLATFSGVAYTGGAMQTAFSYYPVVIDCAGVKSSNAARPVLLGHSPEQIVGHSTEIAVDGADKIKLAGVFSGVGPAAEQVLGSAKNQFPWKLSVGASVSDREFVGKGDKVTVNGKQFTGPLVIARKCEMQEVSFVPIAADGKTHVRIAASARNNKETNMEFAQWLEAKGFDIETLSDEQKTVLTAAWKAEQKPETPAPPADTIDHGANLRAEMAAEAKRISAVTRITAAHPDLQAKAIDEQWNIEKAELEVLRAERPKAPGVHVSNPVADKPQVLECAYAQAAGIKGDLLEASYDPETLDAAHKTFRGRLGLQETIGLCAQAAGYSGRLSAAAFRGSELRDILQASFSQALISDILSNTANKTILQSFNTVESAWRQIAKIGSVSDFKTHTRVRLTGDLTYEELSETGEIRHGKIADETLTIAAKTYAKMLALTREDIVNDDLGALNGVQEKLGRGAALKINSVFWTEFLANSTFFTTGRANYIEGADYALSAADPIAAIAKAEQAFLDLTDPDGDPLAVSPQIILVPTALWAHAREINVSTAITTGGASTKTKQGTTNIYAGRFTPVMSAYLGNSSYTGYSATAWYLLANPTDLATIEVAFLDGKEAPTVESADVDFNKLGIQMRGYHDFGVSLMEYRAGVKVKGAN